MISPSRMLVWDGGDGGIGRVKVNGRFMPISKRGRGGVAKSPQYRAGLAAMTREFARQWRGGPMVGPVAVRMHVYWPRVHRQGAADGMAFGDVDAVIKASLDALEAAGVVTDDAQVCDEHTTKHYDKHDPRIEVWVSQWEEPADDGG